MQQFEFSEELQLDFIKFIIHDKKGLQAFSFIQPEYFTNLYHVVIVRAIELFIEEFHTTPSKAFHIEFSQRVLLTREFANEFSEDEMAEILKLVNTLHIKGPPKNSEALYRSIAEFSAYIELKDTVENVDLSDFKNYYNFSHKVNKAIAKGEVDTRINEQGTLLIEDLKTRQLARVDQTPMVPTPFKQLNRLTSAGGYAKHSIVTILDQPKSLKTAFLVNWARGVMRNKKRCLYIDLENGYEEITLRLEQSVTGRTKKEILSGSHDRDTAKMLRKYRRLGGEIAIRRLPAFSSAADIQRVIDDIYREHGLQFHTLIVDYIGKMSSLNRDKDERLRIANAYIDMENLAFRNDIELVVTAHHTVRAATERAQTRYEMNDIGKAIDIVQNVQVILGVNRSEAEKEAGIFRLEIIAQRDGAPEGRCLFMGDVEKQRFEELTHKQIDEYNAIYLTALLEEIDNTRSNKTGGRSRRKQDADKPKANKREGGDI